MRIVEFGILVEKAPWRRRPGPAAARRPETSGEVMRKSAATFSPLRRKTYMSLFRFRHWWRREDPDRSGVPRDLANKSTLFPNKLGGFAGHVLRPGGETSTFADVLGRFARFS